MLAHPFRFLAVAVFALLVGLCATRPPAGSANGDKHEEKGGHAHVPAPTEYADIHVPLSVWTDAAMIARGREIYTTRCAVCHGDSGDGKGPAALALPLKPANFRDKDGVAEMRDNYWFWRVSEGGQVEPFNSAEFKFRSTPSGQLPTTADLLRTVTEGVRSSGGPMTIGLRGHRIMPSFRYMPEAQRLEVIEYVKGLNRGFWERREIKTIAMPAAPPVTIERLSRGKQLYADAECLACHGERGRGDGPSAPTLKDNRNLPIAATDLTKPERFKNGARPEEGYRSLGKYADAPDYREGHDPRRHDSAEAGLEDRKVRAGDGAGKDRVRRAAADSQRPQAGLGGERHHQA